MFQGETFITLDDKARLAIPSAYREIVARECGNRLTFTYNPYDADGIWLYPTDVWKIVEEQVNAMEGASIDPNALLMQRKLVAAAAHVELDGNARIAVPQTMRSLAGLDKKAVLLGMGNKFELWSEQAHLARARQVISPDRITSAILKLKL